MKLLKGQRVQLTKQGVRAFSKSHGKLSKASLFKWNGRTGIIQEINNYHARVIWEGNKGASDSLSLLALEPVESLNGGLDNHSDIDANLRGDSCPHCGYLLQGKPNGP